MGLDSVEVQSAAATKKVAYVLDDEREIGALVCRMLGALGLVSFSFTDADECVQQFKASEGYARPVFMLLDLALGKTDAVEVFDKLRAARYGGRVLLISGRDQATLQEICNIGAARGLAMLPPLKKPFVLADLKKSMSAAIVGISMPSGAAEMASGIKLPPGFVERALVEGGLQLWYDGKIDLATGAVCGAEALLYAQHPSYGWVSAAGSLPSSDNSIHHPLVRWVIRQMMTDWSRHFGQSKLPIRLSTKVPLPVITSRGFVAVLRGVLPKHPKFPGLILETTDWKQLDDEQAVREVAAQLALYRVGLSIDDIGVVYSLISRARSIAFAEVKLPPGLLDEANRAMCRDAIDVAHRIGSTVCATGAGSGDASKLLAEMGCNMIQLGQPEPVEVFSKKFSGSDKVRKSVAIDDDSLEWPSQVA
jgi:EAL domain-containing protein (putative c-di-GMP-specific phosphodiesterase class I)/ActR/RegA family two-component response regulator